MSKLPYQCIITSMKFLGRRKCERSNNKFININLFSVHFHKRIVSFNLQGVSLTPCLSTTDITFFNLCYPKEEEFLIHLFMNFAQRNVFKMFLNHSHAL